MTGEKTIAAGAGIAAAATAGGVIVAGAGIAAAVLTAGLVIPIYVAGHIGWRLFEERLARGRPIVLGNDAGPDEIIRSLDVLVRNTKDLPAPIQTKIVRIVATIKATLPRIGNLPAGGMDAYTLLRTATNYLPEAVTVYMRLPTKYAVGEKTAEQELSRQLDLLDRKMDDVFEAACRSDADALEVHGRFLEEKFGGKSL